MASVPPTESSKSALFELCDALGSRILSTLQAVDDGAPALAAPTTTTWNQLATQLRILNTVITRLQRTLHDGGPISDYTQETMQSAVTTTSEILVEIKNNIAPIAASEMRRPSVSSTFGRPLQPISSSCLAVSEQAVKDYVRMVVTESQIFSLIDQVLSLYVTNSLPGTQNSQLICHRNNLQDQDSALETSENLKILLRGSRDAEKIREKRDRLKLLEPFPAIDRRGSAATDLSAAATSNPSLMSRISTGIASSASSAMTTTGTTVVTPRQPPSSISRLLGALRVGGSNARSSADLKLAFSQLCQACRDGDVEWARNQIAEGADVNGTDAKCLMPLHYAVLQGKLDLVKLLVGSGACVGGSDGRSSAMVFLAVRKNNIPVLKYLLEEESAPVSSRCCDSRDRNTFRTPLSLAVENGQEEAVELLVEHGADVQGSDMTQSEHSFTPLCLAVDKGNRTMVELLLKCDARINETKSACDWGSGLAALHVAAYKGHSEIIEILLEHGADISISCRRTLPTRGGIVSTATTGVTALHLATGGCAENLLRHGAKVFSRDSHGQFPLSGVVQLRDIESVKILVENGAPINAQDRNRDTALHITCKLFARDAKTGISEHLESYIAIVEVLLAGGANPGSSAAGRRIIRAECDKLLSRKASGVEIQSPGDVGRLQLVDLMKLVGEIVRAEQAVSTSGARDGPVRGFFTQTTLAHLVTR